MASESGKGQIKIFAPDITFLIEKLSRKKVNFFRVMFINIYHKWSPNFNYLSITVCSIVSSVVGIVMNFENHSCGQSFMWYQQ